MNKTEIANLLKKHSPGAYIKRAPDKINDSTELVIYCPVHGDQRVKASYAKAFGCPKCNGLKVKRVLRRKVIKKIHEQGIAMDYVPKRRTNGEILESDVVKRKGNQD